MTNRIKTSIKKLTIAAFLTGVLFSGQALAHDDYWSPSFIYYFGYNYEPWHVKRIYRTHRRHYGHHRPHRHYHKKHHYPRHHRHHHKSRHSHSHDGYSHKKIIKKKKRWHGDD